MIIGLMRGIMDNSLPLDPASAYAAPTALPPINTLPQDPADAYGTLNSPFPEPQAVDQKGLQDVSIPDAMTVYGAGQLTKLGVQGGAAAVKGIGSLFETPESLKSAGITAKTLENMAPGGQNPSNYAEAVEKQLGSKGILAKTAKDTWTNLNGKITESGTAIQNAMSSIQEANPNALLVDAKNALEPIADEALKRSAGLFSATANSANPFFQAYDGLMKTATQQAGKLSLDNVTSALQETGKMMDEGGEETQATFGKLYGKLADVRDGIVNTVAQQANNPELSQTLLKNNADYSTYMRILPAIEKAGYREAIKEGVSAYQKYGGPLVAKGLAVYGLGRGIQEGIDKFLGTH